MIESKIENLGTIEDSTQKSQKLHRGKRVVHLASYGSPSVWLMGGMLSIAVLMIAGILLLILTTGFQTFWPRRLVQITTVDGSTYLGEITRDDQYKPTEAQINEMPEIYREEVKQFLMEQDGTSNRILVSTGNFEITNTHFHWISDYQIKETVYPEWAMVFQRVAWGLFYGVPVGFTIEGNIVTEDPGKSVQLFNQHHPEVKRSMDRIERLQKGEMGAINFRMERARLQLREAELRARRIANQEERDRILQAARQRYQSIQEAEVKKHQEVQSRIDVINQGLHKHAILMRISGNQVISVPLETIVRGYPANRINLIDKVGIYLDRWREFLLDEPREANSEGGVFPAIFGTVVMTLFMICFVAPIGVIAALYLREYASKGLLVSMVRIALNNLAGVPSIVYGVFGVGFFTHFVGATIDQLFFEARLPSPTFGTGGILWASLTLALLTLPVVIVAAEEALAAVPNSLREGSYACGASKWQTIKRIVLPRALPGILTGFILAMARGAGEVAALMMVGAVKLAPDMPVDGNFPFIHLERSFMHLGFHIFDVGFQSQNAEAARPMVFTTTLLLVLIVFVLNLLAIYLRNRLFRKFAAREV